MGTTYVPPSTFTFSSSVDMSESHGTDISFRNPTCTSSPATWTTSQDISGITSATEKATYVVEQPNTAASDDDVNNSQITLIPLDADPAADGDDEYEAEPAFEHQSQLLSSVDFTDYVAIIVSEKSATEGAKEKESEEFAGEDDGIDEGIHEANQGSQSEDQTSLREENIGEATDNEEADNNGNDV